MTYFDMTHEDTKAERFCKCSKRSTIAGSRVVPEDLKKVYHSRMKGIRGKLKELWDRLIRQDASPNAIAAGFAIGLFATFYPFPVLDTLAALAVAWCVRANKAACLIGNNFVLLIYPVIPLLLTAEVVTGRFLLRSPAILPPENSLLLVWLKQQTVPNLEALILGGLVLGIPAALLSFWLVRAAARKWQRGYAK